MQNREATDQKVRELADRIYDGMFNAHMNPGRLCYGRDDVATLITQAIAVETGSLREALEGLVEVIEGSGFFYAMESARDRGDKRLAVAKTALSALPSPGAKAEDTASAEWTWQEETTNFYNDAEGHSCGGDAVGRYQIIKDGDYICTVETIPLANEIVNALNREALREEVERLEKALDQATIRMDIRAGGVGRVNDITGKWEPVQIDINVSPEFAAYLRKRSEAKQAEQAATQPASTNQKDGEL